MSRGSPPRSSEGDAVAPRTRFRDLQAVRLLADLPEHGLGRGEPGTIVHVFDVADAYLVEFVNEADGSTRAQIELEPDKLAPA